MTHRLGPSVRNLRIGSPDLWGSLGCIFNWTCVVACLVRVNKHVTHWQNDKPERITLFKKKYISHKKAERSQHLLLPTQKWPRGYIPEICYMLIWCMIQYWVILISPFTSDDFHCNNCELKCKFRRTETHTCGLMCISRPEIVFSESQTKSQIHRFLCYECLT